MEQRSIEQLEAAIREIPGVRGVRLQLAGEGVEKVRVRVRIGPTGAPGTIARAVAKRLERELGSPVEPDRIEIAREEPAEADLTGVPGRLLFRSVNLYRQENQAEAQVELTQGSETMIGTAQGPAVASSLPRLVARATLEALSRRIASGAGLDLVAIERRRLGGRPIMLSHLVLLQGRRETHLAGSVLVTTDPLEAAVLSVLDALNRILPELAGQDQLLFEVDPMPPRARA